MESEDSFHNGMTLFAIQRQLNPVHAISGYILKIHCTMIIVAFLAVSFRLPTKFLNTFLFSP
jgi:hypothetical protein